MEDQGIPINAAIRVFCDKHQALFTHTKRNMHCAMTLLMEEGMQLLRSELEGIDKPSQEQLAAAMAKITDHKDAICCRIPKERLEEIMDETPESTGDDMEDEAATLRQTESLKRHFDRAKFVRILTQMNVPLGEMIEFLSGSNVDDFAPAQVFLDHLKTAHSTLAANLENVPPGKLS